MNITNTIKKKIIIGCDHAAYNFKSELIKYLRAKDSYDIVDMGTEIEKSVDYPDFAEKVCLEVLKDLKNNQGILLCGTGIGMSITANKIPGIRCGLCHDTTTAKLSRDHNDANVLALGERIVGIQVAKDIVDTFLTTEFSEGEIHKKRLQKIEELEEKYK